MYEPLKIFSYLGALVAGAGVVLLVRFLFYFLTSAGPVGKLQSLLTGAILLAMGLLLGLIGIVSDLIAANRQLVEDIQYRVRRMELGGARPAGERAEESAPETARPTAVAGGKT